MGPLHTVPQWGGGKVESPGEGVCVLGLHHGGPQTGGFKQQTFALPRSGGPRSQIQVWAEPLGGARGAPLPSASLWGGFPGSWSHRSNVPPPSRGLSLLSVLCLV